MSGSGRDEFTKVAEQIPFDNDTNGFTAEDVQAAIEEAKNTAAPGASPAFSLGRSGNTPPGSWLLRVGGPPSNKTGIPIRAGSPKIIGISVGNEDVNTFDVEVYEHEGDEINLTLLTTVSVVAARTGTFSVNVSCTQGRQLAAKITSGSAKNPGVDFELEGT